jgi:ABC-2 type transport system ATP-binding protein
MAPVISIENLCKTYEGGLEALKNVNLEIERGEIFGLLGPNGAGKTTLIGIICGLVNLTSGKVIVDGHDIIDDYKAARQLIGLVPQEMAIDIFTNPWTTARFSRGLFGLPPDDAYMEKLLRDLSLWDKKDQRLMALSGGMKRRVVIAKALAHQPRILFLDEPTAGVDVELRKEMWKIVRELRDSGVTVILTTHYINEAEEMADRVGVINHGELIVVEEKNELMRKLGKKQMTIQLRDRLDALPDGLDGHELKLNSDGTRLVFDYDTRAGRTGITSLLEDLHKAGIAFSDLETTQSSLEEIFVGLVGDGK